MRGFAVISLDNPKQPGNLGGVLRAAQCYGAAQVNVSGYRARLGIRSNANTGKAERHLPVFTVADPLDYLPFDCEVVAVDIIPGAKPLQEFKHPHRAAYIFGAEDATLGKRITDRAQHVVFIPTRICMNLAACVNVVLYDRMLKGGDFAAAIEDAPGRTQAAFYRRPVPPVAA